MRKPVYAGIAAFLCAMLCVAMVHSRSAQGQAAATDASQAASGSAPGSATTNAARSQTATKVWTNDDLSSLHGSAPTHRAVQKTKQPAKSAQGGKKIAAAGPYQSQIAKLQAQLPPIDSQIANLQAALSGQTVNTPRKYVGVRPDDWQAQLLDLQNKRNDIQSRIDALEDQARHAGVPTNALP